MSPLSGKAAASAEVLTFERAPAPPPAEGSRPLEPLGRMAREAVRARRIGEKFVELGLASVEQVEAALAEQVRHPGRPLGLILVELGAVTAASLGGLTGEEIPDEGAKGRVAVIDPAAVRLLPRDLAQAHQILPVSASKSTVLIAVARAADVDTLVALRPYFPAGVRLEPRLWPKDQLARLIAIAYAHDLSVDGALVDAKDRVGQSFAPDDWTDPAVRFVNAVLLDALRLGAATVHFTPDGQTVRLGYRIDGAMNAAAAIPQRLWAAVLQRLRRLAGLEKTNAIAGDGRFELRLGDRIVAARFAFAPTHAGEAAALELIETRRELIPFEKLGLSESARAALTRALQRPQGLLIVAGPKGSGRTATLAALMDKLRAPELSLAAASERAEIDLPGVPHFLADAARGQPMAAAIAAAALHDADVIGVGALDDAQAAQAALDAVRQGRRVLAQVTAADALGALARLHELGLSPAALSGQLTAVTAQRLARKLCPVCKTARMATREEARWFAGPRGESATVYDPVGCPYCRGTGYKGRLVLAETLALDPDLDDMVAAGANRSELAAFARDERGFRSLRDDAVERVRQGELSPAEFRRVVDLSART